MAQIFFTRLRDIHNFLIRVNNDNKAINSLKQCIKQEEKIMNHELLDELSPEMSIKNGKLPPSRISHRQN